MAASLPRPRNPMGGGGAFARTFIFFVYLVHYNCREGGGSNIELGQSIVVTRVYNSLVLRVVGSRALWWWQSRG